MRNERHRRPGRDTQENDGKAWRTRKQAVGAHERVEEGKAAAIPFEQEGKGKATTNTV